MENILLFAALDFAFWKAVLLCAVALGLIIFVHELGHFLVAKACGVRCDKFYLGFDFFGMKLFHFKWDETEYGLGIFPLGGYVKMLGQEDNPGELKERVAKARAAREALEKNENAEVNKEDVLTEEEILALENELNDPRSYQSKSVPQRLAIIVAGVTMNVIFAFIAAFLAFWLGVFKQDATLGNVYAGQSAWESGFQTGDTLLKINDKEIQTFDDIRNHIMLGDSGEEGVPVVYQRAGLTDPQGAIVRPKKVTLAPMFGATSGSRPVLTDKYPSIPGSASFDAKEPWLGGDMILDVNGMPVKTQLDYRRAIYANWGKPLTVRVARPTEAAKAERARALRKMKLNDEATYEQIQATAQKDAQTLEITFEPRKAPHFGVVFEMGPIDAVRTLTPAEKVGLKPGDKILGMEINGEMLPIGDPMTLPWRVHALALNQNSVRLNILKKDAKDTEVLELELLAGQVGCGVLTGCGIGIPELGVTYSPLPKVAQVVPGSQAEKDGIAVGDELISMQLVRKSPKNLDESKLTDKEKAVREVFKEESKALPVQSSVAMLADLWVNALQMYPAQGTDVVAVFRHDGQAKTYTLPVVELNDVYLSDTGLNFEPKQTFCRGNFGLSLSMGGQEMWNSLTLVFRTLGKLTSGEVSVRALGGPVLIAEAAYGSAKEGLGKLLLFVCLISANLAVMNLLPIPVLDGGHVVFLLYEGITGRAPNEKLVVVLSYMGLIFFLALTLFVFGLDLGFIPRF